MYICAADPCAVLRPLLDRLWAMFNTGGPASRTRTETIHASILGNGQLSIRWPRLMQVGIAFPPDCDARDYMAAFLQRHGWSLSEECKDQVALPPEPYFCRDIADAHMRKLDPETAPPKAVLRAALILSLCNNHSYDPGRPVIWTNNRLTRSVELYETGDFYADN